MILLPSSMKRVADRLLQSSPALNNTVETAALWTRMIRKHAYGPLDAASDRRKLMINIGGGYYFRRHWKVMDFPSDHYAFLPTTIDYKVDLTAEVPFPLPDRSVAFYYSSHTLEHIPQEHIAHVLAEVWRTLAHGGVARFSVPDFDIAYAALIAGTEEVLKDWPGATIEQRFLDFFATYWKDKVSAEALRADLQAMSKTELADWYTSRIPRESQRQHTGHHINWWTYDKLSKMLRDVGFQSVYRSSPQGSMFSELRAPGRHTGFDSTYPDVSLFVEAVK